MPSLRLLRKLAASDNRRHIALYFDLLKTKSKAGDARTHLSDEPVEREQMGASFARSAYNYALSQQSLLPACTADELAQRLCGELSHEEPSHEEPSHATEAPPFLSMTA